MASEPIACDGSFQEVVYDFGSLAGTGFIVIVSTPLAWLQKSNRASLIRS